VEHSSNALFLTKVITMAGGRPATYDPDFARQATVACELGATNADLARMFGVTQRTIERWTVTHPEFCRALKVGKDASDDRVERSLYNRAVGYTYDTVKPMSRSLGSQDGAVIEMIKLKEHVPPDVTAAIFWLKNRRKDAWRDKQEHGFTDKDGNDVDLTDAQKGAKIAFALQKGAKAMKEQKAR
jgi:hypothetical protein